MILRSDDDKTDNNNDGRPSFGGGQMPDFGNGEMPDFGNMPEGTQPSGDVKTPDAVSEATALFDNDGGRPSFGGKGDKGGQGGFPGNMPNTSNDNSSNVKSNLIMIGASFVILVVALVIVKVYRRKNIRK